MTQSESPSSDCSSRLSEMLASPLTSRLGCSPEPQFHPFKVPRPDPAGYISVHTDAAKKNLSILHEVQAKTDMFLKGNCECLVRNEKIYILFLSRTEDSVNQRPLIFGSDGSAVMKVHCVPFPLNDYLKNVRPARQLDSLSVNYCVYRIAQIVGVVLQFEISVGVPEPEFTSV
ncbi:Mitochondrial-processing peptidase subunit alpha [Frankliniella fusca]|uniref:Mitochondrial-processing peptidase subunit alpha n=1 Tax=Frankliniella fusca TaxID=407009 RepID=A0AAE1LMG5_9NEOP|nr:Mitochondrial-processing peptidase subunit alpha [Frankliniella fusca]